MSEKPILFNTEMVQAILAGRKTQTRRVVKDCPDGFEWVLKKPGDSLCYAGKLNGGSSQYWESSPYFCPYGRPGDTLWVRETWADNIPGCPNGITYRADHQDPNGDGPANPIKWRPSIFMPRWASRINLTITGVRVERLQDITEDDAKAEGIEQLGGGVGVLNHKYGMMTTLYAELWNSINGKKHLWASNPWVWVIEFEVMK